MERHGFETYFVLGEGLLGESGGGRTVAAAVEAAPPFRFSRMGPKGVGRAARRREPQEDRGRDDLGASGLLARSRRASPTSASSSTTT